MSGGCYIDPDPFIPDNKQHLISSRIETLRGLLIIFKR